jgi:hypothetical protein
MPTTATISPTRSSTSTTSHSNALSPRHLRYTLPLPVQSSTPRAANSLFTFRVNASKLLKVTIGTIIGLLGVTAGWWALDLAMWTSVKEWRDDCREQKVSHYRSLPLPLSLPTYPLVTASREMFVKILLRMVFE